MHQQPNRITPRLAVEQVKTYAIRAPKETHTRQARCEEVNCQAQQSGWSTVVDETSDLGRRQAHYIRTEAGRRFTVRKLAGQTVFRFPPGEQCFQEHRVSLDRPELYLVHGGDWRGATTKARIHSSPDAWVNDFGEHQDRINRTING